MGCLVRNVLLSSWNVDDENEEDQDVDQLILKGFWDFPSFLAEIFTDTDVIAMLLKVSTANSIDAAITTHPSLPFLPLRLLLPFSYSAAPILLFSHYAML